MVPWLVQAALHHHGGCGWPGSRWTSVHQQPSDWFNHCIVMFPCREINGSLHLHGPYASSQPQYEFQPCDHRTCVSPVSLGDYYWTLHFFLRCSCKLSGIFICLCLCKLMFLHHSAVLSTSFYASVFRHQRHFWGTYRSGLKFGMMMYPDHLRNQLDLHHVLFIFLILAQLTL